MSLDFTLSPPCFSYGYRTGDNFFELLLVISIVNWGHTSTGGFGGMRDKFDPISQPNPRL